MHLHFTLQVIQSVNHCNIHLNFAPVGRHHEVHPLLLCHERHKNYLSLRDLVLYCGLRSTTEDLVLVNLKVDPHIGCRVHAAPKLFPCNALPLRVWNVSFPFDLHSAAVSDSHLPGHTHTAPMPCSDHAILLKATAQHSRQDTGCWVPARIQLLPSTTWSSTKIVIRSIPFLLTRIHTYD